MLKLEPKTCSKPKLTNLELVEQFENNTEPPFGFGFLNEGQTIGVELRVEIPMGFELPRSYFGTWNY